MSRITRKVRLVLLFISNKVLTAIILLLGYSQVLGQSTPFEYTSNTKQVIQTELCQEGPADTTDAKPTSLRLDIPPISLIRSMADAGLGLGFRTQNFLHPTKYDAVFVLKLPSLQCRLNRLYGIGIAVGSLEIIYKTGSILPVYFMVPVGYKNNPIKMFGGEMVHSPLHYFFIGGHPWDSGEGNYLNLGFCRKVTFAYNYPDQNSDPMEYIYEALFPFDEYNFTFGAIYQVKHDNIYSAQLNEFIESRQSFLAIYLTFSMSWSSGY